MEICKCGENRRSGHSFPCSDGPACPKYGMPLDTNPGRISVIVPVYNVAPYLPRCVDSLLRQTYRDLEILLVDDGSTDASGKICDDYRDLDPRIRVIHKENGGAGSARNAGLDAMTGEFITFVDADDFVSPDYCQVLLEDILEHEADISKCLYIMVTDPDPVPAPVTEKRIEVFDGSPYLLFQRASLESPDMKLYRSSLLQTLRFSNAYAAQDSWFAMDLMVTQPRVVYDHRTLYYYYIRNGSITRTASKRKLDRVRVFDHWVEAAEQYAPGDRELLSLVAERWVTECISAVAGCYPLMSRGEKRTYKRALSRKFQYLSEKTHISLSNRLRFRVFQISVPLYRLVKIFLGWVAQKQ